MGRPTEEIFTWDTGGTHSEDPSPKNYWVMEKPAYQHFNYLFKNIAEYLRYIDEEKTNGIATVGATTSIDNNTVIIGSPTSIVEIQASSFSFPGSFTFSSMDFNTETENINMRFIFSDVEKINVRANSDESYDIIGVSSDITMLHISPTVSDFYDGYVASTGNGCSITNEGDIFANGDLLIEGTATIGTLAGFVKATAGVLSAGSIADGDIPSTLTSKTFTSSIAIQNGSDTATTYTIPSGRTTGSSANADMILAFPNSLDSIGQMVFKKIVNANIDSSAAIDDSKLATISTAGKVSNSATTATTNNTASTIVLRDAEGAFSAGVVTVTGVKVGTLAGFVKATAGVLSAGNIADGDIPSTLTGKTFTSATNIQGLLTLNTATNTFSFPLTRGTTGQILKMSSTAGVLEWATDNDTTPDLSNYVISTASSITDNTVPRFDSTSGKVIQASGVIIDDDNNISNVKSLQVGGGYGSTGTTLSDDGDISSNGDITFSTLGSGFVKATAGALSAGSIADGDIPSVLGGRTFTSGIAVRNGSDTATVYTMPSGRTAGSSANADMVLAFTSSLDSVGQMVFKKIVNANVDSSAAIDGSKIQAASVSNAGVVSTSTQTFAGEKTFNSNIICGGVVKLADGSVSAPAYSFANATNSGMYYGASAIKFSLAGRDVVGYEKTTNTARIIVNDKDGPGLRLLGIDNGVSDQNTAELGFNFIGCIRAGRNILRGYHGICFDVGAPSSSPNNFAWRVYQAADTYATIATMGSTGDFDLAGKIRTSNGSVSAPAYSFTNAATYGMYYETNTLAFSANSHKSFVVQDYLSYTQLANYRIYQLLSNKPCIYVTDATASTIKNLCLGQSNNSIASGNSAGQAGFANGGSSSGNFTKIQTFFDYNESDGQGSSRYAHNIRTEHDSSTNNKSKLRHYLWKYGDISGGIGTHPAHEIGVFQSTYQGRYKSLSDNTQTSILEITCVDNTSANCIINYSLDAANGQGVRSMIGEIKCMVVNQNGTITTNIVTVEDQWFPEQFTTLSTVLVADTAKAILKITANTSLDATINMYFEAKYLGNTSNNLTFL